MQFFSFIIYNSAPGPFPAPAVLGNSAAAFLFVLIKFQHSYGYQTQAQIATSARKDILRFKMFTQCKMTAEKSIQRDEWRMEGRSEFFLFCSEKSGVSTLKDGMRKKQMGTEMAPELPW